MHTLWESMLPLGCPQGMLKGGGGYSWQWQVVPEPRRWVGQCVCGGTPWAMLGDGDAWAIEGDGSLVCVHVWPQWTFKKMVVMSGCKRLSQKGCMWNFLPSGKLVCIICLFRVRIGNFCPHSNLALCYLNLIGHIIFSEFDWLYNVTSSG